MTSAQIPTELQQFDQWVLWRLEGRNKSKETKVPYSIRGTYASSTNKNTWSSYDAVCEALKATEARDGSYSGIGFVLTDDDPFVGVDLDHCIKDGVIDEWAQSIVNRLNSYTEITPSGEGLRIFIKATLPREGRKRGHFEAYESGRYLTITGQHLNGTPVEIHERQAEIVEVHAAIFSHSQNGHSNGAVAQPNDWADAYLLEQAMGAKNGQKFKDLWTGKWEGNEKEWPSKSEADLALASLLSFWTGRNPDSVDRLFRVSGLMSDKWDEKHYADGRTYGQGVVELAVKTSGSYFDEHKLETTRSQEIRREHALEWIQGQPGFDQLDIVGVRQIGKHIAGVFQLISNSYGPLDIGTIGDLNSWLKPRANIMARTPIVLPPLYSKKEKWNQVLDTIITLVHENGGAEDDAGSPGEITAEAIRRFAATWDNHRFDLTNDDDRLAVIRAIQLSTGVMDSTRCFISTSGEVILQAQALASWMHIQFGESVSTKSIGQDLTRLRFKGNYLLRAQDPELGKRLAVKVFLSPKGFMDADLD